MRDIYNEDQSPGTPEAKQNFFQCLAGCGPSQNYFNFINLIPSRLGPGCCPFSCFTLLFLCIISRTLIVWSYFLFCIARVDIIIYEQLLVICMWTTILDFSFEVHVHVQYWNFFFKVFFPLLVWCCVNDFVYFHISCS